MTTRRRPDLAAKAAEGARREAERAVRAFSGSVALTAQFVGAGAASMLAFATHRRRVAEAEAMTEAAKCVLQDLIGEVATGAYQAGFEAALELVNGQPTEPSEG